VRYLFLILILAGVLRFYNLANNPPGLTWDEAAFGYNAYSILLTGKEEYGNFLPLNLKSFGDWKPALYAYIDIPFIAIFGLNEWAVRFPNALFGVLSVLVVYLLVWELFKNKSLALLSAFILTISPWHIQFTRPAYEPGTALFFNLLGALFFIKGVKNSKLFVFSALMFILSLLTYQSSKLFVPIIVFVLFALYFRKITFTKYVKVSIVAFIIVFVSFTSLTLFQNQGNRLITVNYFAYQRSDEQIDVIQKEDKLGDLSFQILHGEWWAYTRGLFERYLIYFSPKTLFIEGDYNQRHRLPDVGMMYYYSAILLPLGLMYMIRLGTTSSKFVLIWLLLAPLPAVLSRDLVASYRAMNMLFPIVLLQGAGLWWLVSKLKVSKLGILGLGILLLLAVFNFTIFLDRYFIHAPIEYSEYWLYGYKEVFTNLPDLKKYESVIISDKYGQPYIYYLFYNKYPPTKFQKQVLLDQPTSDVGTVRRIDNIEFRNINISGDINAKNRLIIDTFEEIPSNQLSNVNILKETKFLNGLNAFRIMETK
jgi:4-amino-4-deoxy-L-arabinose transferase-like glycosyltransferase